MVAEWDTDISATFLIFRLKWSTDAAFFKVLGKLFHKGTRRKKSFVSNKWCLVWAGSAFPQSFLSYKQSEAERKDFEDIPEQGHSWFYTSFRLSISFVEDIASPSRGWRGGGLSSYERVI